MSGLSRHGHSHATQDVLETRCISTEDASTHQEIATTNDRRAELVDSEARDGVRRPIQRYLLCSQVAHL